MKALKKITCIIIIALAGAALVSSCSKEPEKAPQTKAAKKGQKTPATAKASPPVALDASKNILNATRNGQYVDLNWQVEMPASKIKRINVVRSSVGMNQRMTVAVLDSKTTHYKDSLPDGNAQQYWLVIVDTSGKNSRIGPVRVDRDPAGLGRYIKPEEDKFKVVITRADDIATLKWDFPEADCKTITVTRLPRPTARRFQTISTHVITSMECNAQYADTLPDSNADYWYWFKITTKSSAIILKGPIKAEYN